MLFQNSISYMKLLSVFSKQFIMKNSNLQIIIVMKMFHWRKLLYFSIYVDTIVGLLCTVIYKLIMYKAAVNVISKILKKNCKK